MSFEDIVRVTFTGQRLLALMGAELSRVVGPQRSIEAELVWEPPWSTERMSARAKAFMGW